ncbi:DUF2225 domain-containing protein [Bacillus sp. FJAT-45350]|uniref:DUF2225 domain-containing protein n=1 Tax=Bacillus sp. FJAT-45350 TaxID=2011014 RepID=UPI000BB94938|nr:DUF2225 domain-containing protein [Bacillus sp. FJAT-45350]
MTEQLDPLYDKTIKCLVCDNTFTTKKVRSRFGLSRHMESDFFTEYIYQKEDIDPLLYYVCVCPSCGYSFSEEASTYFIPGTKQQIMENITRKWQGHEHFCYERTTKEAIDSYKLGIYSGNLKKERPIVMGGLHMRLAWVYRRLNKEEEEKRFSEYALQAYEKSYFDGDYKDSSMSAIRLTYLIGELYRKFENYQKASSYFSKLIHIKQPTKDKRFIEMARDQWYVMREDQRSGKAPKLK